LKSQGTSKGAEKSAKKQSLLKLQIDLGFRNRNDRLGITNAFYAEIVSKR